MKFDQKKLVEDLRVPIRSFRLIALETVIQNGASEEILEVLEELKACEEDLECQNLIAHAISAVKGRVFADKSESLPLDELKTDSLFLLNWWKNSSENEKMRFLSEISGRVPAAISKVGPAMLLLNNSKKIESRIIRIFAGQWPAEKIESLKKYVYSSDLSVKVAALRAITHEKPEILSSDLPSLLSAGEPQIKAFAIRALVKIDPEETLNHLEGMLFSNDSAIRFAGVINCTYLPFDLIRPLLLKFVSAETSLELINRAGWILKMNPDEETPYRLFEIAEDSFGEKASVVKELLQDSFRLLEKSGVICGRIEDYRNRLQTWVLKKNALRFVKQLVGTIESNLLDEVALKKIRKRAARPEILEALDSSLTWPVAENVKDRIKEIIVACRSDDQSSEPGCEDKKNVMPEESQVAIGSDAFDPEAMNRDNYNLFLSEITGILASKRSDSYLVIQVLRKLRELGIANHCADAQKLLCSANPEIVIEATDYLAAVNPDSLFSFLGKLVAAKDPGVVCNAIGVLRKFDYNQSVLYLKNLLFSIHPEKQRTALDCISQFDFHLVRDILAEFIVNCRSESLVKNALCHFEANPDFENIYCLYKIERKTSGVASSDVAAMRKRQSLFLSESGVCRDIDEKSLSVRFQKEVEKEKNVPDYAYVKTVLREQKNSYSQSLCDFCGMGLDFFLQQHPAFKISAALLMIVFSIFLFFPGSAGVKKDSRAGAVKTREIKAFGRVIEFSNEWLVVELDNGKRYTLHPERPLLTLPDPGERVEVTMIPYRRFSEHGYSAKLINLHRPHRATAVGELPDEL